MGELEMSRELFVYLDSSCLDKHKPWTLPLWLRDRTITRLCWKDNKRLKGGQVSVKNDIAKCNKLKRMPFSGTHYISKENEKVHIYDDSRTFKISSSSQSALHIIRSCDLELTKVLGAGGFGCVYLGYFGDIKVAVKKMHKSVKNDRAREESFRAELNVSRLKHKNIVRMLGSSPVDMKDGGFIVMEYAGDRNLQHVISDPHTILDTECRIRYALDVCEALSFIHSQHVIHLDLKPANIIISSHDSCKLGDFGCCQIMEKSTGTVSPTQRSYLTGTFAYRAPELLRGEAPSAKADIYSMGVTLWQMASRALPYAGENQHVVIFGVVAYNLRPTTPVSSLDLEEPVELCYQDLLVECWDGAPLCRPSAEDLVDTLREWTLYL